MNTLWESAGTNSGADALFVVERKMHPVDAGSRATPANFGEWRNEPREVAIPAERIEGASSLMIQSLRAGATPASPTNLPSMGSVPPEHNCKALIAKRPSGKTFSGGGVDGHAYRSSAQGGADKEPSIIRYPMHSERPSRYQSRPATEHFEPSGCKDGIKPEIAGPA